MAPGLSASPGAIDWRAPWLKPLAPIGQQVAAHVLAGIPCHDALNLQIEAAGAANVPVRFVPQADLPADEPYERFIFNSKLCPTRGGLHDFFNGLCWIHFPQTKLRLNQLQAAQIQQHGIQPARGALRDALTVFDENAAFLQAPDALWDALVAKDWHTLFVTQRRLWDDARLVLFGHALLEKLVSPRKPITAHVHRVQAATHSIARALPAGDAWDAAVVADLSAEKLLQIPFANLPVLGVPGWWPGNENPAFYDDASVFRPPRTAN